MTASAAAGRDGGRGEDDRGGDDRGGDDRGGERERPWPLLVEVLLLEGVGSASPLAGLS